MRIDVHNHAFPNEALALLRSDSAYGATFDGPRVSFNGSSINMRPVNFDGAAKLEQLSAIEIDGAVLSATPVLMFTGLGEQEALTLSRAVNAGLAAMAEADSTRLRWMAHVPLDHPDLAVTLLEEAVQAGAVGVEVPTRIDGRRIDEDDYEPFWAAAARLRIVVFPHPYENEPHPGLTRWHLDNVIGNLLETTVTAERLICAGVLDRHPDLQILLAHAGGFFPYQAGRLRHARSVRPELAAAPVDPWTYCGQLIFDSITHDAAALRFLLDRVGRENVVLGTDLPAPMAPEKPITELRDALGEEATETVATTNAARLYGFAA
jgi:aminocarboxymuconate-semialdehyde decarboxylase